MPCLFLSTPLDIFLISCYYPNDRLKEENAYLKERIQEFETARERSDTVILQPTRQMEQSQRLLEYHQEPWYRREKDMDRLISLVLIVVIIIVGGNISTAKANGAEICYFHGVEHPAPSRPGREIGLGSATLGGDNTLGVSASLLSNVLNGALGGIAGSIGGCLFGVIIGHRREVLCTVVGAAVGAAVGGYLDSKTHSGDVAIGSIVGSVVLTFALLIAIYNSPPHGGY